MNAIRTYEMKRLDALNIKRSLLGAAARAKNGEVILMIETKKRLPKMLEQIYTKTGSFFEAVWKGECIDDELWINVAGRKNNGKYTSYYSLFINISDITNMCVAYEEK